MRQLLVVLLCAASLVWAEPPPIEAYGRVPAVFDVAISPDGGKLALAGTMDSGRQFIQIVSVDDGAALGGVKTRDLTDDARESVIRSIRWADDIRLSYLQNVTMPAIDTLPPGTLAPGQKYINMWRTTLFDIDRQRSYLVTRDDNLDWGLAFTNLFAPLDGETGKGAMAIRSSPYREGRLNVYTVNLKNGRTKARTKGNTNTRTFVIGPQGYPVGRLDVNDLTNHWQLYRLPGTKGAKKATLVAEDHSDTGYIGLVGYRDDGTLVVLDRFGEDDTETLYGFGADNTRHILFAHEAVDVAGVVVDPRRGTTVGVRYVEHLPTQQFFDAELAGVHQRVQALVPKAMVRLDDWDRTRQRFVVFIELSSDAGGWYLYHAAQHQLQRLGMRYPDLQGTAALGERMALDIPARDGAKIPGYLTMPVGADKPPLIVLPHGGPAARDALNFDWWASFLASRGYAVVQPNFRGSHGYGREWEEAGYREWGGVMQHDLQDTLTALQRSGLVDPEKACIMGASYGGYAALLAGLDPDNSYRCVASVAGVSDLEKMLKLTQVAQGRSGPAFDWWTMLIGERKDKERLRRISPVNLAKNAQAPFLLIHGRLDTVVPIDHSRRMEQALKKADKEVRLVEFRGEDHWLSDSSTRIAMLREIEQFLYAHLPR